MIFISHRGNLSGSSELENNPNQIDICLEKGFECEIDLRYSRGHFYLGHDEPQYKVDFDWILERSNKLWIHCKDMESLEKFTVSDMKSLNYFWHQSDQYTLTSKKYVWVFPGQTVIRGSIAVLPEKWIPSINFKEIKHAYAICTDYVGIYAQAFKEFEQLA
jgi:hypothetical protein